ncbi:hypothetical protein, partial [Stieleria mannarensis]|uniref:hypothetical protein n=1 Tax=Stieleria mannarensis TaxID=2755585 RepID=UPI001C71E0AC
MHHEQPKSLGKIKVKTESSILLRAARLRGPAIRHFVAVSVHDRLEAHQTFSQQSDLATAELNRSFTTKLSMIG